jgi:hypothetical protein
VGNRDLQIAGDGAPTIDEGAIAEFALAIGVSTDSGRIYLGDAVEMKYRIPRIWAKVTAGEVPVWKARKVAQATKSLPPEGAGFVDRALYFALRKCSFAEIDRQVEKARAEFDPAETERRRAEAAEKRHVKTHLGFMTSDGVVPITAMADVADAVAFEEYVSSEAAKLDPAIPLQVRRSMVLGMLGKDPAQGGREVVIYAHVRPDQAMVDVDNTRSVITPEHLKDWCQAAGTTVTVKPVIDLNEEITTDSYEPTERQKEQTRLRWPTCPFPYCDRPSWRWGPNADNDHITEFPAGATTSSNLAPRRAAATTGSRLSPPGPTAGSPVWAGNGPPRWATDISADRDPADHGWRGHHHARTPVCGGDHDRSSSAHRGSLRVLSVTARTMGG